MTDWTRIASPTRKGAITGRIGPTGAGRELRQCSGVRTEPRVSVVRTGPASAESSRERKASALLPRPRIEKGPAEVDDPRLHHRTMNPSRCRPRRLALATVALAALPLPAFANTGWAFLYLGALSLVVVLVTLAIETPLVRWGTGAGWWPALGATAFANLVSFIFGLLADLALLGDPERLRAAVVPLTDGPDAAGGAIVFVIALSVVLGAAIELAILWLIFARRLRPAPAAILFAVNVLLSGIGAASGFTPEDYEKVSEAEAARVQSYYAPEIRFMRNTLADLPALWSDEAIVVVDGNFVYPGFEEWLKERQAGLAGLRFVSLTISGFTAHDRPAASISRVPRDLVPPIVAPWEGQGVRIDRAARRYVTGPRPGPAEPIETYRYTIGESGFTITALFDPPP